MKIHEVWHFPEENRRTGLFAEYVNTWLKLKQESAGWPSECVTEQQKAEYVQSYEQHEGIKLDPEQIAVNPGRKSIAKLLLNRYIEKIIYWFNVRLIKRMKFVVKDFLVLEMKKKL